MNSFTPENAPNVAVFGLGIIGSRSADNLIKSGYSVQTWNRTAGKHSAQVESAESAAATAQTLCFYLKDGVACRQVFELIRPALTDGKVLVNHSTIDLETTLWLNEQCAALGVAFLDCPFTGSKDASAAGALVYYAGGNSELVESLRPLLEATAKEIHHLGKVGDATVVKITTNLISASTIQAISEAMAISGSFGISPELFTAAVSSNACGSVLSNMKMPLMATGNYDTHFSLHNMLKDSKFAIQLAGKKGLNTPGIQATSKAMSDLCDNGHADLDYCALYKQFD